MRAGVAVITCKSSTPETEAGKSENPEASLGCIAGPCHKIRNSDLIVNPLGEEKRLEEGD